MAYNPQKVHYQYGIKDFYKLYTRRKPVKKRIPYKVYRDLVRDFFSLLIKKIVRDRWTFYIPNRLGFIMCKSEKKKLHEQPVNKWASKQKKKRILHTNNNTFQRIFSFKWHKVGFRFKNSKYYEFTPMRGNLAEKNGAGKHAIIQHIKEVTSDPTKKLIP